MLKKKVGRVGAQFWLQRPAVGGPRSLEQSPGPGYHLQCSSAGLEFYRNKSAELSACQTSLPWSTVKTPSENPRLKPHTLVEEPCTCLHGVSPVVVSDLLGCLVGGPTHGNMLWGIDILLKGASWPKRLLQDVIAAALPTRRSAKRVVALPSWMASLPASAGAYV